MSEPILFGLVAFGEISRPVSSGFPDIGIRYLPATNMLEDFGLVAMLPM